jgi:hypothetical protein
MSEKQVPTSKATGAIRTFKWLFLCVGALVALEVFQSSKRPTTCCTAMGTWFVSLRRRNVGWNNDILLGIVLGYCWVIRT